MDDSAECKVTAFHLRNRDAKISLKISWNGVYLENTIYSSQILRCDSRHDVELQTAHTDHQDEGSYPQQPFEEIS